MEDCIDPMSACRVASIASCRCVLEKFTALYLEKHNRIGFRCPETLRADISTSELLRHFEVCSGVSNSNTEILGRELSKSLNDKRISLPSAGRLVDVFKTLSERLHQTQWLRSREGKVVVVYDMPNEQKRLFIRYLLACGEDVVILGDDGALREPTDDETSTPPKKKQDKNKRKRT